MDAHHIESTLRDGLRETLDTEHGPHPEWAGSPAAVRLSENQPNRWPLRAIAAAAAVLAVAIVGFPLLGSGFGGTSPTPSTPRLPLLARGVFDIAGRGVMLQAVADGSSVTGRLLVGGAGGFDLQCTRTTEDGLIMIGGYTEEGTLGAVVLKRGSPVQAAIWSPGGGLPSQAASCLTFLDEQLMDQGRTADLEPIEGFVELGVDAPPSSAGLPLLARGDFVTGDGEVELEATGEGSGVMGRMKVSETESDASFTVDLQCARTTEDGLIMIGGYTIETAGGASGVSPEGTLAAVVLKRGSPVGVNVWSQSGGDTSRAADCLAFLDEQLMQERNRHPDSDWLGPISGTVELGQDQPTPVPTSTVVTTTSPLAVPPFGLAGNGVIALAKDGDIFAADRPGGDTRPLVTGPEFDSEPMFSPDGTWLAFRRETDAEPVLMVADADGANVVQLMPGPLDLWSFAPDGRSVVGVTWIDDEPRVIVHPVDPTAAPTVLDIRVGLGGQEVFEWGGPRFRPTNPQEILVKARPEPDGPAGIYVYDLATGEIRKIVERAGCTDKDPWAPGCYMHDVVWSPTGEDVHYRLDAEDRVVAADGSDDRVRDDSPGEPGDNQTSPWSNDGTRVVVNRESDGIADVQAFVVSTTDSGGSVQLACGPTTAIPCAESWSWSPDDSILLGSTQHIASSYGGPMETFLQADPTTGRVTELAWDLYRTPTWQRVAP